MKTSRIRETKFSSAADLSRKLGRTMASGFWDDAKQLAKESSLLYLARQLVIDKRFSHDSFGFGYRSRAASLFALSRRLCSLSGVEMKTPTRWHRFWDWNYTDCARYYSSAPSSVINYPFDLTVFIGFNGDTGSERCSAFPWSYGSLVVTLWGQVMRNT